MTSFFWRSGPYS